RGCAGRVYLGPASLLPARPDAGGCHLDSRRVVRRRPDLDRRACRLAGRVGDCDHARHRSRREMVARRESDAPRTAVCRLSAPGWCRAPWDVAVAGGLVPAATVAGVLLLAYVLRSLPHRLSPQGLGVDHWFWKPYIETYRRERRFPPELPQSLLDEAQWYPPL